MCLYFVRVLIFGCLALSSLLPVSKSETRELLQRRSRRTVTVTSEEELIEAVSNLGTTPRILLALEEVNLNETLIIDAPGVVIRGVLEPQTRIQCRRISGGALIIRNGPTRIESVEFIRCRDHSAVVVDRPPGRSALSLTVQFRDVHFYRNGDARALIYGGAVNTITCQGESCLRPRLRFISCQFSENRATYGGALYAEDADLDLTNTTFSENEADLSGGAIYIAGTNQATLAIDGSLFSRNAAYGDARLHGFDESELLETSNITLFTVGMGGAVFARDVTAASVTGSTMRRNRACRGGGGLAVIYTDHVSGIRAQTTFAVEDSTFERNYAFCEPEPDVLHRLGHIRATGGGLMSASLTALEIDWRVRNSTFVIYS